MKRLRRSTIALLVALPAVVVGSFVVGRLVAPQSEFVGSDTMATRVAAESDPNFQAWIEPLFAPGSAEIESGLFALFAAVGAGILGFVVGRLWERRHSDGAALGATRPVPSESEPIARPDADAPQKSGLAAAGSGPTNADRPTAVAE